MLPAPPLVDGPQHLFPVPKDDTKRIITWANRQDYISFRHHTYVKPKGSDSVELTEVRPWRPSRCWRTAGCACSHVQRHAEGLPVPLRAACCLLAPSAVPVGRVRLVCCVQCGPRFELKLYQVKLGTMDQQHAENEWQLRAYTRAAKKQRLADDAQPAATK